VADTKEPNEEVPPVVVVVLPPVPAVITIEVVPEMP
jgi:hypothetical protein